MCDFPPCLILSMTILCNARMLSPFTCNHHSKCTGYLLAWAHMLAPKRLVTGEIHFIHPPTHLCTDPPPPVQPSWCCLRCLDHIYVSCFQSLSFISLSDHDRCSDSWFICHCRIQTSLRFVFVYVLSCNSVGHLGWSFLATYRWRYNRPHERDSCVGHAPLGILCLWLPIVFNQCHTFGMVDVVSVACYRVDFSELQKFVDCKEEVWGQCGVS